MFYSRVLEPLLVAAVVLVPVASWPVPARRLCGGAAPSLPAGLVASTAWLLARDSATEHC